MNKVLHQVWIQGEENLPAEYSNNRSVWREQLPDDWAMKLWDEKSALETWPEFSKITKLCATHATRADIILARALRDYGGLAVGTDSTPNNAAEMLAVCNAVNAFITLTPGRGEAPNGMQWSAAPNHPFWNCVCKHQMRNNMKCLSWKNVPSATGPGCYIEAFRAHKWNLIAVSSAKAFTSDWNGEWKNQEGWINPGYAASWQR